MLIANAFSLNMLATLDATIRVAPATRDAVAALELESAIGHADTAAVVAADLGLELAVNRVNVQLHPGDTIIVAQYRGPRLPEGATTLPEGASLAYCTVTVAADA